jgi:hypothetical protein
LFQPSKCGCKFGAKVYACFYFLNSGLRPKCVAPLEPAPDANGHATIFASASRRKRTPADILGVRNASRRWRCPQAGSPRGPAPPLSVDSDAPRSARPPAPVPHPRPRADVRGDVTGDGSTRRRWRQVGQLAAGGAFNCCQNVRRSAPAPHVASSRARGSQLGRSAYPGRGFSAMPWARGPAVCGRGGGVFR